MEYNDEAIANLEAFEEMAKAYHLSLKDQGFVFLNLEEEGKSLLIEEVFDILTKLKVSYKNLGCFFDSQNMLSLTNDDLENISKMFSVKPSCNFYVSNLNKTKCFINSISLENELILKLLFLSQKCEYGKEILQIIIKRTKYISKNLNIPYIIQNRKF